MNLTPQEIQKIKAQINMHKTITVRTEDLFPHATNARVHNEHQINQLCASIKEFGFTNPVLIDKDGGIIAGHGRVMAAIKMDLSYVPCISLDHLTAKQRKAYIIADNQLALNATWDDEMLGAEVRDLLEDDYDLKLLGFEEDDLENILSGPASDEPLQLDEDKPPKLCKHCGGEL